MFRRIQRHLWEQLGSGNVRLILADSDGTNLLLSSNRHGNGYVRNPSGFYQKSVPLRGIPRGELLSLKYKETHFYNSTTRDSWQQEDSKGYVSIQPRRPMADESGVLSSGTQYAFCRTGNLADALESEHEIFGFSNQCVLAHEGAHGVISLARDRLEDDLFGGYEFVDIVDESVAQLVGISYMERFSPGEAARYMDFIAHFKTDPVHEEAFRLVLKERERVEEMRKVVKSLFGCRKG